MASEQSMKVLEQYPSAWWDQGGNVFWLCKSTMFAKKENKNHITTSSADQLLSLMVEGWWFGLFLQPKQTCRHWVIETIPLYTRIFLRQMWGHLYSSWCWVKIVPIGKMTSDWLKKKSPDVNLNALIIKDCCHEEWVKMSPKWCET